MDFRESDSEVKISRIVKPLPQRIKNAIAVLLGQADVVPPLYRLTVGESKSIDEINAEIAWSNKVSGLNVYSVEADIPRSAGDCFYCGEPVHHTFPWYTGNPNKPNSKPMHEECMRKHLAED